MARALLLPNPSASGFTGGSFREVQATLGRSYDVTVVWPNSASEATAAARAGADAGYDVVLAMGGDGVVHRVGNGLLDSGTPLGIIPAGTTNVLARILGIPTDAATAAAALVNYRPVGHTLAQVAGQAIGAPSRSHTALFALGIGFDADVVEVAERRPHSKLMFGSVHYARSAIGQVFGEYRGRPANLRVQYDDQAVDAVAVMVQIHAHYTYFGRVPMFVARGSGLCAAAIEEVTPWRAAQLARRAVLSRSLEDAPGTKVFRDFAKIEIEADPPARYQADGELLGQASSFTITPAIDALRIMAPS